MFSMSSSSDQTMNDSPPATPSSNTSLGHVDWEAKYHEVSELLQETRAELDDFQTSSKELEEELERELESTEQQMSDLRNKVERVERERDDCKSKLTTLQGTHNTTVNSLQRELDALRQQHALIKVQMRELEVGNDDLERSEREVSSSLADLEGRYARALEEKILLEHELQDRVVLEEDMQRLRDELREATEECSILKDQNARLAEEHGSLDEQNKTLSEELSRTRAELAQARHLVELARGQSQFPSAPSTATSSAKSISSHDSRSPTPSAASRTSSDLQLEDLIPKPALPASKADSKPEPASANVTPRAKSAIPVSPSTRTMSVTRRPAIGAVVPTAVRTPNGQSALLSRAGFAQNINGTPDPLRRSTTLPTLSSPVPTRLPTARNSPVPAPTTPRPRLSNGKSALGRGAGTKRGTAVQMVGEMRARVRTLEQKINRVPLPRMRNPSLKSRVLGNSKENDAAAKGWNPDTGADSPGWVIVTDGPGKNDEVPSPSPLPRQPLVERGLSFTSERSERKRTSFSSDRSSRRSTNEDPPPSAFRGVTSASASQTEFPTISSGRTTPASTVGSNRVVSRPNGQSNGRVTPGLPTSTSLFGISIRRPQSRNASHGNPSRVPPLPTIPSLSRIPSSPLPNTHDLPSSGRPMTPTGMTMLPMPTDRSPSKSENLSTRRPTRRLSLHPSGHTTHGSAATPALPAGLTGQKERTGGSVGGIRKPVSPPAATKASPGGMESSPSMLGMSRIGRPNSMGLGASRIGTPKTKDDSAGRVRSGSVGWRRER